MLPAVSLLVFAGCGTTAQRNGTEQLLASDAVDRSIADIDFSALAGRHVFLDDDFIRRVKGIGFVNAGYIISALRQQISASGCLIEDSMDDADYIIEARVGSLGTDQHDITYGLPASNGVSTAVSTLAGVPLIPVIPELSVAKRQDQAAVAKIGVFVYHRESRAPVLQSGLSVARSDARDTWILGAGPFQRGTAYEGSRFAGSRVRVPFLGARRKKTPSHVLAHIMPRQFIHPDELERQLAASAEDRKESTRRVIPADHTEIDEFPSGSR